MGGRAFGYKCLPATLAIADGSLAPVSYGSGDDATSI